MHTPLFYLKNTKIIWSYMLSNFGGWLPDKFYLQLYFPCKMGYKLDLKNPISYSQKLQWLKLYNRRPEYTMMVDKYAVKEYVKSLIGEEYVIPTLGVWNRPEDIEWENLPQKFVLKCTHDSGGVIICKNKQSFNKDLAIKKMKKCLKYDFYSLTREWPYKNVPRRIIAEEYIENNDNNGDLPDYKFFCFDGKVKALFVATERQNPNEEVKFDFFDENYNHLPFRQGHDHARITPSRPGKFEEMKKIAELLSAGIPHVRVDLYEHENKVYFGELTFFHFGGFKPFEPVEWDFKFGDYITLPKTRVI